MASRVLFINEGRLAYDGTVAGPDRATATALDEHFHELTDAHA